MSSPPVGSLKHRLLQAAFEGKLKLLKELGAELDFGEGLAETFVDFKDTEGRSALHFAAWHGKTHIREHLVQDLGIDINMEDGEDETPLNYATLGQHNHTVAWLAANGANLNLANDVGFSALQYAAVKGLKDLMPLLISNGADIEADSHAGTPLHCAAAHGREEVVKMLLDRKANGDSYSINEEPSGFSSVSSLGSCPNAVSHHFFTPLVNSILAGSFECASLLLKQAGADPNLGLKGATCLVIAAAEGETDVIKCLPKAGANPNVTYIDGLTPLEIAALHSCHAGVMVVLPVTSIILTIPDWSFVGIMMHVQSEEGRRQREEKKNESFLLWKTKGEEAFKRKDFMDAIYWYTQARDFFTEPKAISSSPVGSPQDNNILQTAFDGKLKLLKELGAELHFGEGLAKMFVDVKDTWGRMALHLAAWHGKTHICKYLVWDLGVDINMKDGTGETPLIYATMGQHNQTVAWLAVNGANPNLANDQGFCALHFAALKGLIDLMRPLICKGTQIEAESIAGTPL